MKRRMYVMIFVFILAGLLCWFSFERCIEAQEESWGNDVNKEEISADAVNKLDQILANQMKILEELAAIKEELNVIKIRSSI